MPVNDEIFDKSVRHAIALEKYTNSQVQEIATGLKGTLDDLQKQILKKIPKGEWSANRQKEMRTAIDAELKSTVRLLYKDFKGQLEGVALTEAEFQTAMLREVVPIDFDFRTPTPATLRSLVNKPFQGQYTENWFNGLGNTVRDKLDTEIFKGVSLGESIPEISKRFQRVTDLGVRSSEGVARTAVNHVVAQAREETYGENADIISGVQYVSTLDTRTSPKCRALDGQIFPVNEGPRPPQHFRCRSTTVPIIKGWQEFGLKDPPQSTRASMNGQVPDNVKYYDWLGKQSVTTQNDVLGKKVGELFRDGKLSDKVLFTGNPITLKSLQGGLKVLKPQKDTSLPFLPSEAKTPLQKMKANQSSLNPQPVERPDKEILVTKYCGIDTEVVNEYKKLAPQIPVDTERYYPPPVLPPVIETTKDQLLALKAIQSLPVTPASEVAEQILGIKTSPEILTQKKWNSLSEDAVFDKMSKLFSGYITGPRNSEVNESLRGLGIRLSSLQKRHPNFQMPKDFKPQLEFTKSLQGADGGHGSYTTGEDKIQILSKLVGSNKKWTPGEWAYAAGINEVASDADLVHEYGHAFEFYETGTLGKKLQTVYESKPKAYWEKNVTKYGAINATELWAESFSIYSDPRYGKTHKLPKEIEDVFDHVFGPRAIQKKPRTPRVPTESDDNWVKKLSPIEKQHIQDWTENWNNIRNADVMGLPSEKLLTLKKALSKAPRTRQELHRSIVLDPDRAALLANAKYFDNLGLSHYTADEERAKRHLQGKIQPGKSFVKIKGQMSGVNISQFSVHKGSEFVTDKGARLQIKSKRELEVDGIKGWEVEVEEAKAPERFKTQEEWQKHIFANKELFNGVDAYTGRQYTDMRRMQRGEDPRPDKDKAVLKKYLEGMQEAYDLAPLYTGEVYRGAPAGIAEQWLKEGGTFELNSWHSFTTDKDVALKRFDGDRNLITIKTKRGMIVGDAGVQSEKETVLPKGNKVKVVKVVQGRDGFHRRDVVKILREIANEQGLGEIGESRTDPKGGIAYGKAYDEFAKRYPPGGNIIELEELDE